MRTWRGSPSAAPPATSTPARARRVDSSSPSSVGCAAHTKFAWLSVTSKPRSRSAAVSRRAPRRPRDVLGEQIGAAAQRLEGAGLGYLGDAEVGLELGQQLLRAWAADRVADAQPGEAPGLREAAEDEQPRMVLEQLQRGVGRAGRRRTRRATRRAARRRPPAGRRAAAAARRRRSARRSDRSGWRARSRVSSAPSRPPAARRRRR